MWQDFAGGIATDDQQAAGEYDFLAEPNVAGAPVIYSVADTVQAWVNGEENNGWVLTTESHNDWIWWSAEAEPTGVRPLLEVVYRNTSIRGDFNSNGRFDVQDIDLLSQAIRGELQNSIFDLNLDNAVNEVDLGIWVREVKQTWFGDANLDGEFNSRDIVQVFQHGEYEDDVAANSTWGEGDWNADHEFNTRDVVAAFQDGGYEAGRRPAPVQPVPEPRTAQCLQLLAIVGAPWLRRLLLLRC